jgi:hypothetical protein
MNHKRTKISGELKTKPGHEPRIISAAVSTLDSWARRGCLLVWRAEHMPTGSECLSGEARRRGLLICLDHQLNLTRISPPRA